MKIEALKKETIDKALKENERQYLLGNLKLPQDLKEIFDENVEIGISFYKEYTVCKAHYHSICTEYQYVLSGKTKYLDLESNDEYEFVKDDFFVIRPNTKYYQKNCEGTKILFIKVPGINDKKICELSKENLMWGKKYE